MNVHTDNEGMLMQMLQIQCAWLQNSFKCTSSPKVAFHEFLTSQ